MALFNAAEIACIQKLAELFEKGTNPVDCRNADPLELPPEQRRQILDTMEAHGFITEVLRRADRQFLFTITPEAVQAAREIRRLDEQSQEPEDIVEKVTKAVRKHHATAWIIIAVLALTVILTLINQILSLLEHARLIHK